MKKFKYEILLLLFFVISRIPSLGVDSFNTDVWKWKARSYDFGSGVFNLDFKLTLQKYHPGVPLMWLGSAGIKIFNLYHGLAAPDFSLNSLQAVFQLHFVQKLLVVVAIGITLAFSFYVARKLFGLKYALIAFFLLILEPFFIGLTRVFHLEGLLSSFMVASLLWFYYWIQNIDKNDRLVVASMFSALALLTKTSSLVLVPFFVLAIVFFIKGTSKFKVKAFIKWAFFTSLFILLMWPALWVIPGEVFRTLYRGIFTIGIERAHEQVYFGKVTSNPGIFFYPIVFIYKSSILLIAGLVYLAIFFRKSVIRKQKLFVNYLLLFLLLYTLEIVIPSKKLDRYILPLITVAVFMVAFLYERFLDSTNKFVKSVSLILFVGLPLITAFYLHSDYLSYHSVLGGGLRKGVEVVEPKWLIGKNEIVNYFALKSSQSSSKIEEDISIEELIESKNIEGSLVVGFPEKYYTQIWPFMRRSSIVSVIKDLTPQAKYADYFVYPVWADDSGMETRFELMYIDAIQLRGVPIYKVYKRVN